MLLPDDIVTPEDLDQVFTSYGTSKSTLLIQPKWIGPASAALYDGQVRYRPACRRRPVKPFIWDGNRKASSASATCSLPVKPKPSNYLGFWFRRCKRPPVALQQKLLAISLNTSAPGIDSIATSSLVASRRWFAADPLRLDQ